MPHIPDIRAHAGHDPELVAAYAAGDATGDALELAATLVGSCAACAELHRDLRSIAAALPALPAPVRTRDFRLTAADAARLRPGGWRALLDALAGPRFRLAAPLGTGLAALGLAGILLGTSTFPLATSGSGAAAPAAVPPSAAAAGGAAGAGPADGAGAAGEAMPVPAPSAAAASVAPDELGPRALPSSEAPSVDNLRMAAGPTAAPQPGETAGRDTTADQAFSAASPAPGVAGTTLDPGNAGQRTPRPDDEAVAAPATSAPPAVPWPAVVLLLVGLALVAIRLAARGMAGRRIG